MEETNQALTSTYEVLRVKRFKFSMSLPNNYALNIRIIKAWGYKSVLREQ